MHIKFVRDKTNQQHIILGERKKKNKIGSLFLGNPVDSVNYIVRIKWNMYTVKVGGERENLFARVKIK